MNNLLILKGARKREKVKSRSRKFKSPSKILVFLILKGYRLEIFENFDLKKSQRDQDRGKIFWGHAFSFCLRKDQNQYQDYLACTFFPFSAKYFFSFHFFAINKKSKSTSDTHPHLDQEKRTNKKVKNPTSALHTPLFMPKITDLTFTPTF